MKRAKPDVVVEDSIPVKSLRALRGSVTSAATGGITAERIQAKQAVAKRITE